MLFDFHRIVGNVRHVLGGLLWGPSRETRAVSMRRRGDRGSVDGRSDTRDDTTLSRVLFGKVTSTEVIPS